MKETPKKLYHYTDINKLALILKSQSIRFGRLDKVNDPMEGLSSDFHSLAQYIFISSWTSNESEDFALWNMYTPSMRGVRIELELPLFKSHTLKEGMNNSLVSKEDFVNESAGYFIYGAENIPEEILYTDNNKLLKPYIKRSEGLHVKSLSKYKSSIWSIEQEYRYQIHIVPVDNKVNSDNFLAKYNHLIAGNVPPPMDGYYIKIDDNAFKAMRIRLGPKLLLGDSLIVEALVNSFNPTAVIEDSLIASLIR